MFLIIAKDSFTSLLKIKYNYIELNTSKIIKRWLDYLENRKRSNNKVKKLNWFKKIKE